MAGREGERARAVHTLVKLLQLKFHPGKIQKFKGQRCGDINDLWGHTEFRVHFLFTTYPAAAPPPAPPSLQRGAII